MSRAITRCSLSRAPFTDDCRVGSRGSVKHQSPQLDALAQQGVGRRRWIDEGSVRTEPGPSISLGIVALQQQSLIDGHLGEIEPAMIGAVFHGIDLAAAARIDQV